MRSNGPLANKKVAMGGRGWPGGDRTGTRFGARMQWRPEPMHVARAMRPPLPRSTHLRVVIPLLNSRLLRHGEKACVAAVSLIGRLTRSA